jgi:hypothetical protein
METTAVDMSKLQLALIMIALQAEINKMTREVVPPTSLIEVAMQAHARIADASEALDWAEPVQS